MKKTTLAPVTAVIIFVLFLPVAVFAGTVNLTWTAPTTNTDGSTLSDLAGYKVYYGTSSGNYTTSIDVGKTTSYQLTLAGGYTYYFAVTAYDTSGNESTYSNEVYKTLGADTTPPQISSVYAGNITATSAVISWTTDENATSQVEYGTTTSFGSSTTLDSTLTTNHSQTLTGLSPSTTYYYRVISSDASSNQAVSSTKSFTTAAQADTTPPVISNIGVSSVTSSTVTISWVTNEPSTSQVDYGLTTSYGYSTTLDSTLATVHSVTITGLASGTTYDFRVRSSDASSNEAVSSNNTFTTSNTAPSVTSLTASPSSGTTPLTVTFSATASDTDGYITDYDWDFDGDGTYDQNTSNVSSVTHTYTSAGTYSVRVRVTDNGGATATSSAATVSVSSSTNQPPVVSSVTVTPSSGKAPLTVSLSVSASDPDGTITTYEWDFDGNGTIDATTTSTPTTHTYSVPGTYNIIAKVTDNAGATATGRTSLSVTSSSGTKSGNSSSSSSSDSSGGCFIATAAYGSYLDPHVKVLRQFRDHYLLTNTMGRAFVRFYYRTSPPIADYIARHSLIKTAVRFTLTPLVYGLEYPAVSTASIGLLGIVILFRRRRSARKGGLT